MLVLVFALLVVSPPAQSHAGAALDAGAEGQGARGSSTGPTEYTVTIGPAPDFCVIAAPEGRQFTRSLVGWGPTTLPLTQN